MTRINRTAATVAALLVAPALVATTTVAASGERGRGGGLPLLDRAADGPVDAARGATRLEGDQTATIRRSLRSGRVKNVILIIGDGMGDSEITIARNYLEGAGGAFAGLDALPLTGQMTHYSVDQETGKPDYTPDSAATGTAWATGMKTYDNAISVDRHGTPQRTLLELAKRSGRATGNVSTSEIQDATPAVQVSKISLRACKGPEATTKTCPEAAKENGGTGSISEQLLDARPDVTLGGGSAFFEETATAGRWEGETLAEQAEDRGYRYLTSKRALSRVYAANQDRPVLGLFAENNFPTRFASAAARNGGGDGEAVTCQPEPEFSSVPSLRTMTDKAIDLLAANRQGRRNGFFLQVESASIDKRNHAADACGQIGETEQIDEAIQEALAFAQRDRRTLVIVTADHAHTSQIVDSTPPGPSIKLRTADDADMLVSYGTAATPGSMQHTGSQVRVAGYGPGAGNVVGLIDQTDLFHIMKRAMR